MAYDAELADRIQRIFGDWPVLRKKRMFGGLAYLLNGNMAFGLIGDALMVRCGPDRYAECLAREGVREFDFTGRPMKGWVVVGGEWLETERELRDWMNLGLDFAASLPPKA
ncbi:MAG TPA: TfoX/Sxy family protein [Fluviicoccus sp.]|nr:TfoX/Sxy family protein [Fluviicoccus sp.]